MSLLDLFSDADEKKLKAGIQTQPVDGQREIMLTQIHTAGFKILKDYPDINGENFFMLLTREIDPEAWALLRALNAAEEKIPYYDELVN